MSVSNSTGVRFRQWATSTIRETAWAPLCVFLVHVLLSRGVHAYDRWPSIDIPMHFVGGIAIAWFLHRAALKGSQYKLLGGFHPATHCLLVFTATCTVAVFWEFAEFLNDRFAGGHSQAGLDDTLGDIFLGLLGGAALLAGEAVCWSRQKVSPDI